MCRGLCSLHVPDTPETHGSGRAVHLSAVPVLGGMVPFLPGPSGDSTELLPVHSPKEALTKTPCRFIAPQAPYLGVSSNKGHGWWVAGGSQDSSRKLKTWRLHFLLPGTESPELSLGRERL